MIRALVAMGMLASGSCQAPRAGDASAEDPTARDYKPPPMPRAKVLLPDAYGGRQVVEVEVAATPAMRERGMMWRTSLAEGKGMLFLFPRDQVHSFWMMNTLIPLDMIFLGADGTVRGIIESAEPRTTTPRSIGLPARHVLEVPGGWSRRIGLRVGARAELVGISGIEVVP